MSDPLYEYSVEISRRLLNVDLEVRQTDPDGVILLIKHELEKEWWRTRPFTMARIRLYFGWLWIRDKCLKLAARVRKQP